MDTTANAEPTAGRGRPRRAAPPGPGARRRRPGGGPTARRRRCGPWFGVAKVGPRAVQRGRARRHRDHGRARLRGLRRPEAPRHPHHGGQGVAGARLARAPSYVTMHAFGGVDMLRAGVEGLARGRRPAPASPEPTRPRGHRAHQRRPARRRTSCPSGWPLAIEAGLRRPGLRGRRRSRGPAARPRPHHRHAGHPARRRRPPTTRPGRPPRRRRSTPAPTCSSSAGRSPRRRTRSWRPPQLVESHHASERAASRRSTGGSWRTHHPRPARAGRGRVCAMAQPPQLTPEQRAAALEKAAAARKARAELKERLKLGSISLAEVLERVRHERSRRQDEGPRRARVPARCGQGQGPPHHGGDRHRRHPPAARARRAAARSAARRLLLTDVLITLSGLPGSGTSTVARTVAAELGPRPPRRRHRVPAAGGRAGPEPGRVRARSPKHDDCIDRALDDRLAERAPRGRRRCSSPDSPAGWPPVPSWPPCGSGSTATRRAGPPRRRPRRPRRRRGAGHQPRPRGLRAGPLPGLLRHRPHRPVDLRPGRRLHRRRPPDGVIDQIVRGRPS